MVIYKFFFVAIYLLFAYFQLNDPDPVIWCSYYAFIALFFGFSAVKQVSKNLTYIVMGLSILFSLVYLPGVVSWAFDHPDKPYIEHTREFFGIMIVVISLIPLALKK